jgi:hypothetical protein
LAKGRLRSNKRVQQCNGDLRQRAKQPQDPWQKYIDFMPTASLLMMMFSPRLTNAKTKVEYEGTKNSPQTKKKHQPQRPGMGVCQQRNPNAKESAQNNH